MSWPKGKPRGPRRPKVPIIPLEKWEQTELNFLPVDETLDVPIEQTVIPSKSDRPPTQIDNNVTVIFQDGETIVIDSGTIPRVVEAGLLFMVDTEGRAHHIPIGNNIRRFYWKVKSK